MCAVGRWAARGKAYLVMLRAVGDMLTMQQLHFAADVRPSSEIEIPKQDIKPAELTLAQQLRIETGVLRPGPHPGPHTDSLAPLRGAL